MFDPVEESCEDSEVTVLSSEDADVVSDDDSESEEAEVPASALSDSGLTTSEADETSDDSSFDTE